MSAKTITIGLISKSLKQAIREITAYKSSISTKTARLNERLAELGAEIAGQLFSSAQYDGTNDVTVSAVPINGGWRIEARGNAVAFIEFGTGITFNSPGQYPGNRPAGVKEIGKYGYHQGANPHGWTYEDASGLRVRTFGNPAAMPMYFASKETHERLVSIAREVFNGD